ncbi:MAG TPA: hypothetical protein VKA43_01375 [Gammaproteobacteria bacterium]|nr:hypothetical protein [Gammaproteobacteria bacterium]
MKASIVVSICLAVVAAGLTMFWNNRGELIPSSAREVAVPLPTPIHERFDVTTSAVEQSRDTDFESAPTVQSPSEEGIDGRLARQQEMVDALYALSSTRVIQRLTDLGLAQSDSEVIARRYAADVAECAMAALETEAARQLISVDELLSRVAAAGRDGGNAFDAVDRSSLEANALPCEADALQRAGIPFKSDEQISDEEIERLRECVEQTISNTDVSNKAAAIEICAQNVLGDATRP